MEVLLLAVIGIVNLLCFVVGAKVGQAVTRGEEVKLPSASPVEAIRKHEARKEADATQEKINAIMQNIENYNGTAQGQIDVPRG